MPNWSQDYTVKSNARRAAKAAKVDPSKVQAFVKAGQTLYRFPMPDTNGLRQVAASDAVKKAKGEARVKKVTAATHTLIKKGEAAKKAAKKARTAKPAKARGMSLAISKRTKPAPETPKLDRPIPIKPAKAKATAGEFGSGGVVADRGGKFTAVAALLRTPGGASMPTICAATGWKPHSARARISVDVSKLLTKGEEITRRREEGVSHYAIVQSKQQSLPLGAPEAA